MKSSHEISIDIQTFILMFNALDASDLKDRILEEVKGIASKNPRAHSLRGLCFREDGTLFFSEERYEQSVYRGKVGTYSKGLRETLQKALRDAEFIVYMKSASAKADAAIEGESAPEGLCPISDLFQREEEEVAHEILAYSKIQKKLT